jgi:hypothetical protein
MLWIESIFESTLVPPFFTNSRVDMVGFVNLHKVVVKRNAFSTFPSAQNGGEKKKYEKPWNFFF